MADALVDGDGGNVILWSDGDTSFSGSISATGVGTGIGGFAEVSGKNNLHYRGVSVLDGPSGGGELLLDPTNVTISYSSSNTTLAAAGDANGDSTLASSEGSGDVTVSPAAITTLLNAGTSVTIQATSDIIVDGAIAKTDGGDAVLTLTAGDDVTINQTIFGGVGKLGVSVTADSDSTSAGNVTVGAVIQTNGGDFSSSGVNYSQNSAIFTHSASTNGSVNINHTGTVAINDNIGTSGSLSGACLLYTSPSPRDPT